MRLKWINLLFIFFTICLLSCSEEIKQAKKLEGLYGCTVDYHYWQSWQGDTTSDIYSTYPYDLPIGRKKDSLIVHDFMIPLPAFEGEVYGFSTFDYQYKIQFKNDSVNFFKSDLIGGPEVGETYIYRGIKTTD